jgi:hypothetical protein
VPLQFHFENPNLYVNIDFSFCFGRNDGMEDRYSVLIRFDDQLAADAFHSNFNGKKFSPGEVSDTILRTSHKQVYYLGLAMQLVACLPFIRVII